MPQFKKEKNKKRIVYKTPFSQERFEKFKKEGVTLRLGNQTLKLKEKKEIFKKNLKKPKISAFNINDSQTGVVFSIDEVPDKVYVDYKAVNRYSAAWINAAVFDTVSRNKETTLILDKSKGQAIKIRVTYLKGDAVQFEDIVYEDKAFKFFNDPPEIIIHKRDNIVLKLFNLERFSKSGYVRIFKKENNESETCVFSSNLPGRVLTYIDNNVKNHDYYTYRAEVYDDLGNVYNVLAKKFLYQKSTSVRNIDVKFDEESNSYRFDRESDVSFRIEKYNSKTEKVEFIEFSEKLNSIIFNLEQNNQSDIIHVESYDSFGNLTGWAEVLKNTVEDFRITDASVLTNSLFQKVISWNYTGNVDTFIITMKNSQRQKILATKPHRKSTEGYIYCIDENYSKERIYTEYIINAVNEFGTIIDRKRLVTQW